MAKSSTKDQTLPNAGDLLPPKRYIYCMADLEKFHLSSVRRDLLSFANALGRSCISCGPFNPEKPLADLSPAMAALRGALDGMEKWVEEIPPDKDAKARFGNPLFRKWHERLVERTKIVVGTILDVHAKAQGNEIDEESRSRFIEDAHRLGLEAARGHETIDPKMSSASVKQRDDICVECAAYWHASFGHPTRLDYGTGHEASFLVFLYALYRAGCFEPKPKGLRAVTLSIFSQYLKVCRGLQTIYMLEPAGSHGVWGLDDYHCLPFYFGACQLINNFEGFDPRSIHDQRILEEYHQRYLYFGCIRYIMQLKTGAPFRETSPMLNDISSIETWSKVSSGLLRLFEGEVLGKLPVVQHFVFGELFKATWQPVQVPQPAPSRKFIDGIGRDECIAPWAAKSNNNEHKPTKAPWAK